MEHHDQDEKVSCKLMISLHIFLMSIIWQAKHVDE